MSNGLHEKMNKTEMLFIFTSLVSLSTAIRVDWNTNNGPIVPPTTTIRPVPKPPFKEPAPVWEIQYDDQINPNPYQYVLPTPSRPKFLIDNYARAPISSLQDKYLYDHPNYGQVIMKYPVNNYNYNNNNNDDDYYYNDYNIEKTVPTLAVYYVPNVGLKYSAVVPISSTQPTSAKTIYLKDNDIYDIGNNFKYNSKLNAKYNAKLKKYKAYEKIKKKSLPHLYVFTPVVEEQNYLNQQLLPYISQTSTTFIIKENVKDTAQKPFYSAQHYQQQHQQQQQLQHQQQRQQQQQYYQQQQQQSPKEINAPLSTSPTILSSSASPLPSSSTSPTSVTSTSPSKQLNKKDFYYKKDNYSMIKEMKTKLWLNSNSLNALPNNSKPER